MFEKLLSHGDMKNCMSHKGLPLVNSTSFFKSDFCCHLVFLITVQMLKVHHHPVEMLHREAI